MKYNKYIDIFEYIYIYMTETKHNISFSLQENSKDSDITYEELIKEVDLLEITAAISLDDMIAMELDYQTNYTKKQLERICDYYTISKRKKRKSQLVEEIVQFEKNSDHLTVVYQRKKLWGYIEEIKSDKYLRKYLILD